MVWWVDEVRGGITSCKSYTSVVSQARQISHFNFDKYLTTSLQSQIKGKVKEMLCHWYLYWYTYITQMYHSHIVFILFRKRVFFFHYLLQPILNTLNNNYYLLLFIFFTIFSTPKLYAFKLHCVQEKLCFFHFLALFRRQALVRHFLYAKYCVFYFVCDANLLYFKIHDLFD